MSEPVKTFSIGFDERRYSETRYARQWRGGMGLTIMNSYSVEDLVRLVEDVITAADEPFADPAALPLYELARQARCYVTVALCGDGGDETLAGYRRYALDPLLSLTRDFRHG